MCRLHKYGIANQNNTTFFYWTQKKTHTEKQSLELLERNTKYVSICYTNKIDAKVREIIGHYDWEWYEWGERPKHFQNKPKPFGVHSACYRLPPCYSIKTTTIIFALLGTLYTVYISYRQWQSDEKLNSLFCAFRRCFISCSKLCRRREIEVN